MQYSIDVASANNVLVDVQTRSADYQDLADDMVAGMQRAAEGCQAQPVAEALRGYGEEEFGPALEAISNLTGTALTRTNEALTYYSEGNLAMVDESVKALAATETAPADFRQGGSTGPQAV